MRVLVACEFSGVVRRAFRKKGHAAWSCDLLPAEDGSPHHIKNDVVNVLFDGWDLLIAHPPCTRLCNSGVRWLHERNLWDDLQSACDMFSILWNAPIPMRCIENPVMHKHAKQRIRNYQPFAQSIQPWQFGHGECKRTCLWLHNLPCLVPTEIVPGRDKRVHRMPPSEDRWKHRSRFYPGIAKAMADQWGRVG